MDNIYKFDHGEIRIQVYSGQYSPSDVHNRQVETCLIMVGFVLW